MNIYTKKTYITEEKPTPIIYCLQGLEGQLCVTHPQISVSKLLRELVYLIFLGTISEILGPK